MALSRVPALALAVAALAAALPPCRRSRRAVVAAQRTRTPVPAGKSWPARRSGSSHLAETRPDHGRPRRGRRVEGGRHRRRRRLVHDPACPPGGTQRRGLRAGHPAGDARRDPAARGAGRSAQRPHHARRGERRQPAGRPTGRGAGGGHVSRSPRRPRRVPAEPGRGAQARRPDRHRELQARGRRPGAIAVRGRTHRARHRGGRGAVGGAARKSGGEPSLSVPAGADAPATAQVTARAGDAQSPGVR